MPTKKRKLYRKKKKITKTSRKLKQFRKLYNNAGNEAGPSSSYRSSNLLKKKSRYSYGKKDIPSLVSPFRTLDTYVLSETNKTSLFRPLVNTFRGSFPCTGLSPKERSYVIGNCQTRTMRYASLKKLASTAIKQNKIFTIYGNCNPIRKALLERGWVEKVPPNRMNLLKLRSGTFSSKTEVNGELEKLLLSNLVDKHEPNFIWRTKDDLETTIDMTKDNNTLINKLKIDALWTTKQGLCSTMKRNYWFYIEDVAEVIGPRTYISYDIAEIEGFVNDFKITACTSLLKWILSMVANDRPIFVGCGKISMNVIVFALNRCKEYLLKKQNKDIDRPITAVSNGQWNAFLKKYYNIIAKDDVFQADTENKLKLYLSYAKFFLKEIHKYRPQLSCEGCHNIWIIKPAHCSRGRGIKMASKLGTITNLLERTNAKYVIQKYIEEPLLIHETKFDIRQYYMVTSTYPLIVWMYKDCYFKFSSQRYNLRNYHESIHLTNNAVQRKYKNCIGRHTELPHNNMWDLDKYKEYLDRIGKSGVWDNIIYPGMRKTIIGILLSCQDSMATSKNRFELYGCDFILDKEYRPWLIEINACPDLSATTPITGKICPAVLTDLIKVVIDKSNSSKASTGHFECIYRQPMTIPRYGGSDLIVRGYTLPDEYFYRGKAPINECYDHLVNEHDIKATIKKLKDLYDTDIMIEPDDDDNVSYQKEKETCTHRTASEEELSVAATVITLQIEELLNKLPSVPALPVPRNTTINHSPIKSKSNVLQSVQSVTNVNMMLKRSVRTKSELKVQEFGFSQLDDGSSGKGSETSENSFETRSD